MHKIVALSARALLAGMALLLAFAPEALASAGDLHSQAEGLGRLLGWTWALPFAGMLLSIAVFPLLAPSFWSQHFGKVSALWAFAYLVPLVTLHGWELGLYQVLHTALTEYIPFIILLLTLFTITGGVHLSGTLVGRPLVNTGMLLIGTLLASWMGTTGAAMLLIRPLIRANAHREHKAHTVIFFIFLVANIGGCLTPFGDPPLFLGFLKGVSFFWTTEHLLLPFLMMTAILLTVYFLMDSLLFRREGSPVPPSAKKIKLCLEGTANLLLLAAVVACVLVSGVWQPGLGFDVFHVRIELQNVLRDVLLLALTAASLRITSKELRHKNSFEWEPMLEVGKIFAGIFVSMIPAIAILRAGSEGALSSVVGLVSKNGVPDTTMYFWLTGILSSILDNAPTYLVFFNVAGGNAQELMAQVHTLMAISAGAVFMGANTYIGNAPNFMVRSIAESSGVKMPSFFGYMLWSMGILIPSFGLATLVFFR
jgi:Na+/H+ antiporter NhaD/arsenite permease-like protein